MARDQIYFDRQITFYCNCAYEPTGLSGGAIDASSCGYTPRTNEARGERLEWEHVVPAHAFGHYRSCWSEGHSDCVNSDGESYKGRKCCGKVDKEFHQAEVDLHNLVPSIGELNGDRSNHPFGIVTGEVRYYGECDFEVGGDPKLAEPMQSVRGNIARVWLYMKETYDIPISAEQENLLRTWSLQDPVDEWEVIRNQRIEEAQNSSNHFLLSVWE